MQSAKWKLQNGFARAVGFGLMIVPLGLLCGCESKVSPGFESTLFERVEVIGKRGTGVGEFNKPRSLAVDREDNLYVVDLTGRVQKFSPDGKYLLAWQMPQTDKGKPKGMCRDGEGNIVVVEPHYSRVNHHAPDGKLVKQWGTHGTNDGQLAFPRAVATDRAGNIFVSEYGLRERVQLFASSNATFLKTLGHDGTANGEFNRPEGLDVDGQGRLFVADSCNHRIQVFSGDGKRLASYGSAGSDKGQLSYPYDVRVDEAGFQFVCEFGNSRIQVFDRKHQFVEVIGRAGSAAGEFSNPWSIALDSQGNLYVADAQNHRVQKLVRRKIQVTAR
jgi:DNA-binding beta-propeller fold protein YncE